MRKEISDKKIAAIHEFAIKWKPVFETAEDEKPIGKKFARECRLLGFDMDCGEMFISRYDKAGHSAEELKKVIGGIDDIRVLCSGIISNHRFITHYSDEYLTDEMNREWFVTALTRLGEITEK